MVPGADIGLSLRWLGQADSGVHRVGPVPMPRISTGLSLAVIGGVPLTVTATSLLATRPAAPRARRCLVRPS